MFKSFASKDRVGKPKLTKRREETRRMLEKMDDDMQSPQSSPNLSAIVSITVGADQRLFAAHEDVLCHSPVFAAALRDQFLNPVARRLDLPDEEPEVFSCVLEYLYKGDYSPNLLRDKRGRPWKLESDPPQSPRSPRSPATPKPTSTVFVGSVEILRDTAVYCAAEKYRLEELKRLALRKQGLQSGIEVGTLLRSARYAYAHTPSTDSRLRAHYLALIIRSRNAFKKSGTMQMEMEAGGPFHFDLFVALCNHVDDLSAALGQKE